jgi:TolB protein
VWLPDGNGLVVLSRENVGERLKRLWLVSYPGGEARQITNDLNNFLFEMLSVSVDGKLALLQGHINSDIWVAPHGDAKQARRILKGIPPRYEGVDGLAWTPDGRLLYTGYVGDSRVIWSINSDGTDLRQLTPTKANASDSNMCVTADGRYVVFQSNRSGSTEIWRVNSDGSNLKQLTAGGDPSPPGLSPDGQWVVYRGARDGKAALWRISIEGGEATEIAGVPASALPTRSPVQVSPDGLYIAYLASSPERLLIIPFAGGEPVKSFPLPRSVFGGRQRIGWMPDGKAIIYREDGLGLWQQSLNEKRPQLVKVLEETPVQHFAWSLDGKNLAYTSGEATHEIILIENFK